MVVVDAGSCDCCLPGSSGPQPPPPVVIPCCSGNFTFPGRFYFTVTSMTGDLSILPTFYSVGNVYEMDYACFDYVGGLGTTYFWISPSFSSCGGGGTGQRVRLSILCPDNGSGFRWNVMHLKNSDCTTNAVGIVCASAFGSPNPFLPGGGCTPTTPYLLSGSITYISTTVQANCCYGPPSTFPTYTGAVGFSVSE